MIERDVVEREISELEQGDTCYDSCRKLAWLYVVRDHLPPGGEEQEARSPAAGGSEFARAAASVGFDELVEVLDAHMDALKVVQPKEYEAVMDRIRRIGAD